VQRGSESTWLYGNIHSYAYYFANVLLGSKRQSAALIVDTGSRLIGFPCQGCSHCGEHLCPPFDFESSSSATPVDCGDAERCPASSFLGHHCDDEQRCVFEEQYSENSRASGFWFEDQVLLSPGPDRHEEHFSFQARLGCYSLERDVFSKQKANGVMGLAPPDGAEMGVLQDVFANSPHVNPGVFSICLAREGGALTLGGRHSRYHSAAPIWLQLRSERYYSVSLSAVGVAGDFVARGNESDLGEAVIDSGTTLTYFPDQVFDRITQAIIEYCDVHDSCGAWREGTDPICWRLNRAKHGPSEFPAIQLVFDGGAAVLNWTATDYLYQGSEESVWCQAFMRNTLQQTVFGASWMIHKDVIFDIAGKRLGVAPAQCPENRRELCGLKEGAEDTAVDELWGHMENSPRRASELVVAAGIIVAIGAVIACRASSLGQVHKQPQRRRSSTHDYQPGPGS
jgi:hypothetical protein